MDMLNSITAYFEADPDESFRAFSLLTQDDEDAYLAEGTVFNRPLGRLARAKFTLLLRGCRVAAGLQPTAAAVLEVERAQALAVTPPTVVASTGAAVGTDVTATSTEDVPFNGVVYQTGSTTCKRISDEEESGYFDSYAAKQGDPPVRAQQPTIEQLSCFKALIFVLFKIYVDFAVFVQNGNRLLKRIKMSGQTIGPDGILRQFEIFGPPTILDWVRCFRIFRVCCLIFDVVSAERLDRYQQKIEEYANKYPNDWPLIYQAEARTRLEHAPRVRRRGASAS